MHLCETKVAQTEVPFFSHSRSLPRNFIACSIHPGHDNMARRQKQYALCCFELCPCVVILGKGWSAGLTEFELHATSLIDATDVDEGLTQKRSM